ncbi:carbohydrate ABC transporter permease [Pseudarthrobacter scleromae]|uniref:carbohydrate ABC transporter permease n=1 Tax=Pseudarthrobacter scleromae TaxID=158897 RepID=UPI003CFF79EA
MSITTAGPGRRTGWATSLLTLALLGALIYFLMPLWWLILASLKNGSQLNSTFGLWFADSVHLSENIASVFQASNGVYLQWLLNTVLYSTAAALGAAIAATAAGYALAKFDFPGRKSILAAILLAVAVPVTVLVLPMFLILSAVQLTNTPWAVILPSMINPFGVYILWIFAQETLPTELLEAARIDGGSEWNVFTRIALPLLAPGFVTVFLFSFVGTWNNYFLPRLVLSDERLYPLSVGLAQWNEQAGVGVGSSGFATYSMVITGALVAVVPLVVAFLFLQKYWQTGLSAGSVKG